MQAYGVNAQPSEARAVTFLGGQRRRELARLRLRRQDRVVAITSMVACLLAFPLARVGNGPEAAATLLVAAVALMARLPWSLAVFAIAQPLLLYSLCASIAGAAGAQRTLTLILASTAVGLLIPGLWSLRRASAALSLQIFAVRSSRRCRAIYYCTQCAVFAAVIVPFAP